MKTPYILKTSTDFAIFDLDNIYMCRLIKLRLQCWKRISGRNLSRWAVGIIYKHDSGSMSIIGCSSKKEAIDVWENLYTACLANNIKVKEHKKGENYHKDFVKTGKAFTASVWNDMHI